MCVFTLARYTSLSGEFALFCLVHATTNVGLLVLFLQMYQVLLNKRG